MHLLTTLMWWWTAALASPHVTHSGRLIDPTGEPLDTTASVTFELRDPSDVVVYSEPHTVVFEDGYYAVRLGTNTPIDPAIFVSDLDVVVRVDGVALTRQPLSMAPGALSVDGLVQVSAAPTTCSSGAAGALRFAGGAMSFCNGTDWIRLAGRKPLRSLLLNANNDVVDANGNFSFTTTAALQFSTERAEGTHSMSALVYGNAGTGTPDWAIETATADSQWSLHPDYGDWAFSWDYRHTGDTGYERMLFASTTAFADNKNTYCNNNGTGGTQLSSGWMICVFWGASQIYFKGPGATAFWSYPGYHTDWKSLRMEKRGTQLEFFINGVSQGVRTMPTISVDEPRKLYINGSSNGNEQGYTPAQGYSARAQMDRIAFSQL